MNERKDRGNFEEFDYPHDFIQEIKGNLLEIQKLQKEGWKVIRGPNFEIIDSKPGRVAVESLIFDSKLDNLEFRTYFLYESDDSGKIVGFRVLDLQYFKDKDKQRYQANVNSNVNIAKRNKGFLRPLESVVVYILQNEANDLDRGVIWTISNANLDVLKKLQLENNPEAQNKALEQARWQSFYNHENIKAMPVEGTDQLAVVFDKEGRSVNLAEYSHVVGLMNGGKFADFKDFYKETEGGVNLSIDDLINKLKKLVGE